MWRDSPHHLTAPRRKNGFWRGMLPLRTLHDDLSEDNISSHLIGGAFEAGELDAKRAIKQATELALEL